MRYIKPSEINGEIDAPPSKSMMQRAVAAASLAEGTSMITNPSFCDDALAAMRIAEGLGAKVTRENTKVIITGGRTPVANTLDCGESGLCMRMFTPIAALFNEEIVITGSGSLLKRPVEMMEQPLTTLGASCNTTNGKPPITVKGPLKGGTVKVDGSVSSQFISGLLMALPLCKIDSEIEVVDLKSEQYVAMTIEVLKLFGIKIKTENDLPIRLKTEGQSCVNSSAELTHNMQKFIIAGKQNYNVASVTVEGDWSGAAFLLVAGAIADKIKVNKLSNGLQPDQQIINALKNAGAKIEINNENVIVSKDELNAFNFDATNCPDLFPPLVVLACNCKGTSRITGVERLLHKESNRAATLVEEFTKIGAKIKIVGNIMEITGTKLKGGEINSHNDHRIAMACAIAALKSEKGVKINDPECVAKSYPGFFEDLDKLIGTKINKKR